MWYFYLFQLRFWFFYSFFRGKVFLAKKQKKKNMKSINDNDLSFIARNR